MLVFKTGRAPCITRLGERAVPTRIGVAADSVNVDEWSPASYLFVVRAATEDASKGAADELTVAGYLNAWLAHVRVRVRRATYEGYECLVRCHALGELGDTPLAELRPLQLQRLYGDLLDGTEGKRLASGTVLNLHLVLTQAFSQAVRWQHLKANSAAGAQATRSRSRATRSASRAS